MLSDNEPLYCELTNTNLPNGKFTLVWYNAVHQFRDEPNNYFIYLVLKEAETRRAFVVKRNIKEAPGIHLGAIIENQKFTSIAVGEVFSVDVEITEETLSAPIMLPSAVVDSSWLSFSPDSLDSDNLVFYGYDLQSSIQQQQVLTCYDTRHYRNIHFPCYEIARFYYWRSASMIRQVMASDRIGEKDIVQGFHSGFQYNPVSGQARIRLKRNSRRDDAAEIARFAIPDGYAHTMFHRFKKELVKSRDIIRQRNRQAGIPNNHNFGNLRAFFPFFGNTYMKIRGLELSNGDILALQILEEDSEYPFSSLNVEYYKNNGDPKPAYENVTKRFKSKHTNRTTSHTPSNEYTETNSKNVESQDSRLGLNGIEINIEGIDIDLDKELDTAYENSDKQTDLSSNAASSSGDPDTSQMNTHTASENVDQNTLESEDTEQSAFSLIRKLLELAKVQDNAFDYHLHCIEPLPTRPIDESKRWKWKLATKSNKSPRHYLVAVLTYKSKTYTLVDVERDKKMPAISVLITACDIRDTIVSIMYDLTKYKHSWNINRHIDNNLSMTFEHPHGGNDESKKNWIIERLDRF
jgi:hypothetical protein